MIAALDGAVWLADAEAAADGEESSVRFRITSDWVPASIRSRFGDVQACWVDAQLAEAIKSGALLKIAIRPNGDEFSLSVVGYDGKINVAGQQPAANPPAVDERLTRSIRGKLQIAALRYADANPQHRDYDFKPYLDDLAKPFVAEGRAPTDAEADTAIAGAAKVITEKRRGGG